MFKILFEIVIWFWGNWDGLLCALITFVAVEVITSVLLAFSEHKLPSLFRSKELFKRISLFLLVGISHIIDVYLSGDGNAFRTLTILFYISYEGVAILENSAAMGLPIPQKLIEVIKQLRRRSEETPDDFSKID